MNSIQEEIKDAFETIAFRHNLLIKSLDIHYESRINCDGKTIFNVINSTITEATPVESEDD